MLLVLLSGNKVEIGTVLGKLIPMVILDDHLEPQNTMTELLTWEFPENLMAHHIFVLKKSFFLSTKASSHFHVYGYLHHGYTSKWCTPSGPTSLRAYMLSTCNVDAVIA